MLKRFFINWSHQTEVSDPDGWAVYADDALMVVAELEAYVEDRERTIGAQVSELVAYERWLNEFSVTVTEQHDTIGYLNGRIAELEDAARINRENYEFQRNKADKATATIYQFHYAMKDAGWHPGRTDDNLCDIIRAKGKALAELEAEVQALRKDAEWYRWLRRALADRTSNGVSHFICLIAEGRPEELDAAIDAAMNKEGARD